MLTAGYDNSQVVSHFWYKQQGNTGCQFCEVFIRLGA